MIDISLTMIEISLTLRYISIIKGIEYLLRLFRAKDNYCDNENNIEFYLYICLYIYDRMLL